MAATEEPGPGPVVSRWRLRTAVRRLRQQHQLTQDQVAQQLGWSTSKMIRIESGTSKLSVADVQALLRVYKVTDAGDIARMVDWARRGRRRDWWVGYKRVIPRAYSGYIGLETDAVAVSMYETVMIPGLLQTSGYARALTEAVATELDADQNDRIELRLRRQRQVLNQPHPPTLRFVIDEAVLHRTAAGGQGMREQLHHLAAASQLPHVTLRVLPFTVGMHPGLSGPFVLLEFDEGDGLLEIESMYYGVRLVEMPDAFQFAAGLFDRLLELSLSPDDTMAMINRVADRAY